MKIQRARSRDMRIGGRAVCAAITACAVMLATPAGLQADRVKAAKQAAGIEPPARVSPPVPPARTVQPNYDQTIRNQHINRIETELQDLWRKQKSTADAAAAAASKTVTPPPVVAPVVAPPVRVASTPTAAAPAAPAPKAVVPDTRALAGSKQDVQRALVNATGSARDQLQSAARKVDEKLAQVKSTAAAARPVSAPAARVAPKPLPKLTKEFEEVMDPPVIYMRTDARDYMGRSENFSTYMKRQAAHDAEHGVKHQYRVLGITRREVTPSGIKQSGTDAKVAEETAIRLGGGPSKRKQPVDEGRLANRRREMRDEKKYRNAGGTVPLNTPPPPLAAAPPPKRTGPAITLPIPSPAPVKAPPAVKAPAVKAPPVKTTPVKATTVKPTVVRTPTVKTAPVKPTVVRTPTVKTTPVKTPTVKPTIKTPTVKAPVKATPNVAGKPPLSVKEQVRQKGQIGKASPKGKAAPVMSKPAPKPPVKVGKKPVKKPRR